MAALRVHLFVCLMTLVPAGQWRARAGEADQLLFNGRIYTADPQNPFADALAIQGDTIVSCGARAEVERAAGASTKRMDLQGRVVLPGFIDSHAHPVSGGFTLIGAEVSDTVSDVVALLDFAVKAKQSNRGMRGGILEVTGVPLRFWSAREQLNRAFNNGALADTPVLLRGMDYHTLWANQAMRRKVGLTREFLRSLPEADRKFYGHNEEFEPDGYCTERGMGKMEEALPPHTKEEYVASGRAAVRWFNSLGVTAWLEPCADEPILEAYRKLAKTGELTVRAAGFPRVDPRNEAKSELAAVQRLRDRFAGVTNLVLPGIKVFADGVAEIPSQTAAMLKPYRNTGRSGELLFEPARFAELCRLASQQGLAVHVHAIGDRAVRESLNGLEAARRAGNSANLPHTITHLQFVHPSDISRFGELGVIASYQLFWASANADSIDLIQPYVDPEIFPWQYPARSILQSGGVIAGASDWPVSTANVFEAIYQAETRRGPKGVLNADQAMPREAMLIAYTRHAARALGLADKIGTLSRGKKADLIAVDRDVLAVSAEQLRSTTVLWTMLGGRIVYRRE